MKKHYIYLMASWWWGKSITVNTSDAMATVTLSVLDGEEYGCVDGLIVHESQRRKGVGREMMQEIERFARVMGLKGLYLGARKTSFVAAWYMRLGYHVCEDNTTDNRGLLFSMMKEF